jgi:hypothetical protein
MAACKKEAANQPPQVQILSPEENHSFTVPDTLQVQLAISDDEQVLQATATLLDQNNVPVVPGVSAAPGVGQGNITLALPVIDAQLESGPYKILATASDGELTSKQLLPVLLNAVPLRLRAVFTVVQTGLAEVAVHRTDSLGQTVLAGSWSMDLGGAAVSPEAQQLYVAGATTGPLLALDAELLQPEWQLPNQSSAGFPWFTGVDLGADGRLLVGSGDGTLRSLTASNGMGGAVAQLPTDFRALLSLTQDGLIATVMEHRITHEKRLASFYAASGTPADNVMLTLDPVALLPDQDGYVLLFGSSGGQGVVQRRAMSGSGQSDLYAWPSPVVAAVAAGAGRWVVSLANGELRTFTWPGTGSTLLATGLPLAQLAYDPVGGSVYGAGGGLLYQLDPGTGAQLNSWPVSGEPRKVLCLLNR